MAGMMIRLVLVLLLLLTLPACTPGRHVSDRDVARVTAEQVAQWIERDDVALVDVRTREQYEAGHLPGAIHLPLPEMGADDERLAGARGIIVYGPEPPSRLASAGVKKLMRLGYRRVAMLPDGVDAIDLAKAEPEAD